MFVGEVFMMGLMEGQVSEMMGKYPEKPKLERPLPLKDMANEFSNIYLV